jgi:hypothetical protein
VERTESFLNTTIGSRYVARDGAWLADPVASLYGYMDNYGEQAVLVSLHSPIYEPSIQVRGRPLLLFFTIVVDPKLLRWCLSSPPLSSSSPEALSQL